MQKKLRCMLMPSDAIKGCAVAVQAVLLWGRGVQQRRPSEARQRPNASHPLGRQEHADTAVAPNPVLSLALRVAIWCKGGQRCKHQLRHGISSELCGTKCTPPPGIAHCGGLA